MKIVDKKIIKQLKGKKILCLTAMYYTVEGLNNIKYIGTTGECLLQYGKKLNIVYYFWKGSVLCGKAMDGTYYYFYDLAVPVNEFFKNINYLGMTKMCVPYMSTVLHPMM